MSSPQNFETATSDSAKHLSVTGRRSLRSPVGSPIDKSHPAYQGHRAAIRSIERVVYERAPKQDVRVASTGITQLLNLKPLVLTGAGVSTASGIPDYRGPNGSLRRHRPMTYQEFLHDDVARHRYWARSFVGWRHMDKACPNDAHKVLASWNNDGIISGIITQNVDGLHRQAAEDIHGQGEIIAVHGDMEHIECLNCGNIESRQHLNIRLLEANPEFLESIAADSGEINPDGDAELDERWVSEFNMVACLVCNSLKLKPTVVYFGESVPSQRKARINELMSESAALLIVGSSVAVMSGYRLVLDMVKTHRPVAVINGGPTRADDHATFRWRSDVSQALLYLEDERRRTAHSNMRP